MASEDEDVHAYSIFKKISRIKITVSDCGMIFVEPCSIRCLVLTFIMLCLFIDVNRGLKYNLQRWMYYKSFFPSLGECCLLFMCLVKNYGKYIGT